LGSLNAHLALVEVQLAPPYCHMLKNCSVS
jgi:hypothetical protein